MSISALFEKIKTQDFSTATPEAIAKIFKQIQGVEDLIEALNVQSGTPVSLKQVDTQFELYLDDFSYEEKVTLVLILLKLGIFKISLNKDLFNEVDFVFKS